MIWTVSWPIYIVVPTYLLGMCVLLMGASQRGTSERLKNVYGTSQLALALIFVSAAIILWHYSFPTGLVMLVTALLAVVGTLLVSKRGSPSSRE